MAVNEPAEQGQDRGAVRLRAATADDAQAVTGVFLASRAAAMPYLPRVHSDEDTLAWITHVVLPDSTVWVAEDERGELLGFASLDGTELDHLYLRPDALRRGIGSRLLELVRGRARGADPARVPAQHRRPRLLRAPRIRRRGLQRRQPQRGEGAGRDVPLDRRGLTIPRL